MYHGVKGSTKMGKQNRIASSKKRSRKDAISEEVLGATKASRSPIRGANRVTIIISRPRGTTTTVSNKYITNIRTCSAFITQQHPNAGGYSCNFFCLFCCL
jgi:hypothetical protein